MSTKFVVVGARGGTGLEIIRRLTAMPAADVSEVVALVRDPSKMKEGALPTDPRVQLVAGDATQPDTLQAPFTGAKAIFYAASGTNHEQCQAVDWMALGACADVAKQVSSARIVMVSSQLVHPSNKCNPIRAMLNTLVTGVFHRKGMMDFKFAGEQLLRRSGNDYCIVRPGQLNDGPLGEVPLHIGQTNGMFNKGAPSSRADVAAVCVAAALAPGARNTTLELTAEKKGSPTVVNDVLFDGLDQQWDNKWNEGLEGSA